VLILLILAESSSETVLRVFRGVSLAPIIIKKIPDTRRRKPTEIKAIEVVLFLPPMRLLVEIKIFFVPLYTVWSKASGFSLFWHKKIQS